MGDVRAKILEAAIACIQRDGIEKVTSRVIAAEAGVNLAALNYYFGSKDKVLELALDRAMTSAFVDILDDYDRHLRRHRKVREAFVALLDEAIEGGTRFPNVGFALVHETITSQRYDTPFVEKLEGFLDTFFERIGEHLRGADERERRASLVLLWSSVLLSGLLPGVFDRFRRGALTDPEARLAYVRSMVDTCFVPERRARRARHGR